VEGAVLLNVNGERDHLQLVRKLLPEVGAIGHLHHLVVREDVLVECANGGGRALQLVGLGCGNASNCELVPAWSHELALADVFLDEGNRVLVPSWRQVARAQAVRSVAGLGKTQ